MKKTLKFHLISILAVLGFVLFWYLMTDVLHRVNTLILPGPVDVFRAFLNKMTNTRPDGGTLPEHTLSSLKLVLAGYSLGILVGMPLGIAMAGASGSIGSFGRCSTCSGRCRRWAGFPWC